MRASITMTTLALFLAACTGSIESLPPGGDGDGSGDQEEEICLTGASYIGFGGQPLEAGRQDLAAGADRLQVKPFRALAGEYLRVLGIAIDTADFAATFGAPPARWYERPQASASTMYAAFTMAYIGCTELVAGAETYAAAPTAETADTVCRELAATFWDRAPTDDEVSHCASFAVSGTAEAETPREKWAYACASLLTTADFLTY
ncbi:MAG TPA: hypothetical protein VKZ63_10235 [Kofleriaceae bacterium]|nr:hypothetical protein [Kofleriaceae bacterium]